MVLDRVRRAGRAVATRWIRHEQGWCPWTSAHDRAV